MIASASTPERTGSSGPEDEQRRDRVGRAEGLLGEQLADVGERLQEAEGADPVGPVAVLEAADQLALDHRHQRQDRRRSRAKITSDLTTMIQVASTKVRVGERRSLRRSLLDLDADRAAVEQRVGVALGGALDQEADARRRPAP